MAWQRSTSAKITQITSPKHPSPTATALLAPIKLKSAKPPKTATYSLNSENALKVLLSLECKLSCSITRQVWQRGVSAPK
jgi:hypothetical protein